jgi:Protein of unknown function (DUF2752)
LSSLLDRTATKSAAPLLAAGAAAAALAVDVAFRPHERHVPLCPLHATTGLWCPLCGGLRAADSLAHGRVLAALHENALFVASLPLVFAAWVFWLMLARTGRATPTVPRAAIATVLALAAAFAVLRNLPFAPGLRGT